MWEPPHGRYKMFNYPWKNFVKVSGALRHCAFMVMAMHGCILSEIQAPPELRQIFSTELQRIGSEGAKVLCELANKVEKMESLDPGDMLEKVHEAAEELQMKIDEKSYLLVNLESWESRKQPKEFENPGTKRLVSKSLSEKILNLRNWDSRNTNMGIDSSLLEEGSSEVIFNKQISWPSRFSFHGEIIVRERELRTYESASAISLSTFTSLLIEFVARLQNLVDSFEELSEVAEFKKPADVSAEKEVTVSGFWTKIFG